VDIDAGDELVERIKPAVKRSMRREVLGGLGGFGALVEVPLDRYRRPVMVSGTDGVGTKLRLAIETGRHDTIGIDLVAMCANDVVVQGAEPLFFLDYYATGKLRSRWPSVSSKASSRLPAGGMRAGGRRDRRDARHVRGRGLRPRRLLRRTGGEGPHHRRQPYARRRRDHRLASCRTALERLLAGAAPARGRRATASTALDGIPLYDLLLAPRAST